MLIPLIILFIFVLVLIKKSIIIVPAGSAGVKERLGRTISELKPGINIIIPFIERAVIEQTSAKKISIKAQSANLELEYSVTNPGKLRENIADLDTAFKAAADSRIKNYLGENLSKPNTMDLQNIVQDVKKDMYDIFAEWGVVISNIKLTPL